MKKIIASVIAIVASVGIVAVSRGEKHFRPTPDFPAQDSFKPKWVASNMNLPYRPSGTRFDVNASITLPVESAEPARIIFNAQDVSNYNWAEFSSEGVRIGRTEADWETELGRSLAGLSGGEPHQITVKRRDANMLVAVDGKAVLTALDETFGAGEVGAAARTSRIAFGRFSRPQEIEEEIALSDDFMRAKDETGPWRPARGEWRVISLNNPSMSANAFSYSGKGERGLAVAGYSFWDHYHVAVSVKGPAAGRVGLAAAVRGEDYLLLRWSPCEAAGADRKPGGGDSSEGMREIVYVSADGEEVLGSSVGGYVPGQWYRLKLVIGTGKATAFIDGHRVLGVNDPRIYEGKVGLWVDSPDTATFDDAIVGQSHDFRDDFDGPQSLGMWRPTTGKWKVESGIVVGSSDGAKAELLGGSKRWWRYRFSADMSTAGKAKKAGIILNHTSAFDHVKLVVEAPESVASGESTLRLLRVSAGFEKELAVATIPRLERYGLSAYTDGGHIAGFVDGKLLVEGWDEGCRAGRVGLFVEEGEAGFDSVRMVPLPASEPILSTNAIFSEEQSMKDWSGVGGDWHLGRNSVGGVQPRWHRSRFPGDVTLSVPVAEELTDEVKIALSVAKSGESGKRNNGYVMSADMDRKAEVTDAPAGTKGKLDLAIVREGENVAETSFPAPEPLRSVDVRRAGSYVVGYVNGVQRLAYKDPAPLDQSKVAWFARGAKVPDEGVDVSSGAVRNYTFGRAPVDWRIAKGIWTVTNKWQCDPRWSFWSGRAETTRGGRRDGEKLACIWNKRLFERDVTVEFYAGIMMDRGRGGRYEYARDINVTVCGDGRDLVSGYTCMFGGFDDSRSVIARKGKIVRVGGGVIPRHGSIHRKWFYVRAERLGNRIRFNVNDRMVDLSFDDDNPLEGKQIAIWTYDCGIMISRVRISSPGGNVLEEPGPAPVARPKTIYDVYKAGSVK